MRQRIARFERIYRTYEAELDQRRSELARRREEEEAFRRRIRQLEEERLRAEEDFRSLCGTVSARDLWMMRSSIDSAQDRVRSAGEDLERCLCEIERTVEAIKESHRDLKVLENYMGRLRSRLAAEESAAEQALLDEIALRRNGVGGAA
ncbi:MAG: flagellar FliJ family protein [Thermanaerothrix sp.]|nr:flagellar FliJ family protein [Thermanaerothrix sp.]